MLLEAYLQGLSAITEKADLSDLLIRAFSDFGAAAIVGHPLSFGGSHGMLEWNPIAEHFRQALRPPMPNIGERAIPFLTPR